MTRPFTPEQRAAIADRSGSRLLAANAGSGKTAVMVERFVEAVVDDGLAVGAILALTFTEKAAGELRERIRRRFGELGHHEQARAAEGAAVGTIHGFCAGVLRSHPFAAGLDPRFTVLDEPAARRLHDAAWDRAVEAWADAEGMPALDLLAGMRDDLRTVVMTAYDELRSRGERAPRLPLPAERPAPERARLRAACGAAAGCLDTQSAGAPGMRVQAGRDALAACVEALGVPQDRVPLPTDLDRAELRSGAKLLAEAPCEAYRAAFSAYRQACADSHARTALVLADRLLERFAAEAARAKAVRAAVDFEDLQLLVRDLFAADDALRRRWAERFALIMVDEFQDTNRLQLDVLEQLERGNLFAVGDEFQSIYGFRHADVTIFRDRARSLGDAGVRRLRANFRSRGELLDVLNGAFSPIFDGRFEPLAAGRAVGGFEGRLFDPDHVDAVPGQIPVELLVTDSTAWDDVQGLGLELPGEKPWRRAEARLIAERLHEEVERGRRPGEIAVLVRAAASLRLIEQALEERGLSTYVVGGRGYWSQEQVRDGLAYLQTLANPLDEAALYAVLASPFAGTGADGLVLTARAGREQGGAWAALRGDTAWMDDLPLDQREGLQRLVAFVRVERDRAERLPAEVLLERAIAATGYDVAVLARPGGERRLANMRKLMRLAREFERSEGRDLRAFLAYATTQDLAGAREGEAALESDGLDAVRLMTIHRAKGLEFEVVCVADLGRQGPGGAAPLLLGADGRIGLRLRALGAPQSVPALDYDALAAERAAREDEEERRLYYVAMTRARETLILSGGVDLAKVPEPRPGAAPITWVLRALEGVVEVRVNAPGRLGPRSPAAAPRPAGTALPAPATLLGAPPAAAPAVPARLSFSSLGEYGRCGYRWYLRRVLGLPEVKPPPTAPAEPGPPPRAPGLDPLLRGTLVHVLLEDLDFARPSAPAPETVAAVAAANDAELTEAEAADVTRLVEAFAASPLCARLAAARVVRREAPFAFGLEAGTGGPLVHGVVDVLGSEPDGGVLIVDYKTNPLDALDPEELTTRDYDGQRLVYALAALRNGAPRVEVAHCYLERPDAPATAVYRPPDAAGLSERLVMLAGGLLAGRFSVTDTPHRELCGSCPGRRALCSHPETLTLRPAEP